MKILRMSVPVRQEAFVAETTCAYAGGAMVVHGTGYWRNGDGATEHEPIAYVTVPAVPYIAESIAGRVALALARADETAFYFEYDNAAHVVELQPIRDGADALQLVQDAMGGEMMGRKLAPGHPRIIECRRRTDRLPMDEIESMEDEPEVDCTIGRIAHNEMVPVGYVEEWERLLDVVEGIGGSHE